MLFRNDYGKFENKNAEDEKNQASSAFLFFSHQSDIFCNPYLKGFPVATHSPSAGIWSNSISSWVRRK